MKLRILTPLILSLAAMMTMACSEHARAAQKTPQIDSGRTLINGYNLKGDIITIQNLKAGESCNQVASEFIDQCYNAGYEIIYGKNCAVICTGQVTFSE